MIIAQTQRLTIREISSTDIDDLSNILSDAQVMKYSTIGVHSPTQIVKYIENCVHSYKKNGYGHWGIFLNKDNTLIGICGLNQHLLDNKQVTHINYRLAIKHHGKGFATEAVRAVLQFSKNKLLLNPIFSLIDSSNSASIRVAEACGFVFEKKALFQNKYKKNGSIDLFMI